MIGVTAWLESLGLSDYAPKFQNHEYDNMTLIRSLSDSQIYNMVKTLGCPAEDANKICSNLITGMVAKFQAPVA